MHDSRKKDGPDKSPVLAQRAVSEDPRWTRAVGDSFRAILEKNKRASLEGSSLVSRCGLAWDKMRPGVKRLFLQTQGG